MKNRFLSSLLLVETVLTSTFSVHAESSMTAGSLKSLCESETGKLICIGYISGATDILTLMNDLKKKNSETPIICPPTSGISNDQALRIVLSYITLNKNISDKSARLTVILALADAFPCKR